MTLLAVSGCDTPLSQRPEIACDTTIGVAPELGAVPLAQAATARGLTVGTALGIAPPAPWLPIYRAIAAGQFSMLMPENEMKWTFVHPQPDRYDFSRADCLMRFASEHGMVAQGGPLVWHGQLPAWVFKAPPGRDSFIALLREHIQTVIGHYRATFPGRVVQWEVVNEAVAMTCPNGKCRLRKSIWLDNIGTDYIELAFRFAREADPDAKLFLNEIGLELPGPVTEQRRQAFLEMVDYLRAKQVPIDGIGLQGHMAAFRGAPPPDLKGLMQSIAERNLDILVTEFDVGADPARLKLSPEETRERQAQVFRSVLEDCLGQPRCKTFVLWGFSDRRAWRSDVYATPLDADFKPKPAWGAMLQALAERRGP